MTKRLHQLAREFQARLLSGGGPHRSQMHSVLRDGWAALYRWHLSGERVWRIEAGDEPAELPDGLRLATAAVHSPAVCYSGPERGEWILVARYDAAEPIQIHGPEAYAFPEPMITYLTEHGSTPAAGCLNLEESPTWADAYLAPGKVGARWLTQDDIAPEETRLFRALRHWFRPPAIVI